MKITNQEANQRLKGVLEGKSDDFLLWLKHYENSDFTEQQIIEARRLVKEEIKINKKNSHAVTFLALMNEKGMGREQDFKEAKRLYYLAISLGNPIAMTRCAAIHHFGDDGTIDLEEAKRLYQCAIPFNDRIAMTNLAAIYGQQGDIDAAIELYEKLIALGDKDAMVSLAEIFLDPVYEKVNLFAAKLLYQKAFEQENTAEYLSRIQEIEQFQEQQGKPVRSMSLDENYLNNFKIELDNIQECCVEKKDPASVILYKTASYLNEKMSYIQMMRFVEQGMTRYPQSEIDRIKLKIERSFKETENKLEKIPSHLSWNLWGLLERIKSGLKYLGFLVTCGYVDKKTDFQRNKESKHQVESSFFSVKNAYQSFAKQPETDREAGRSSHP